jgi:hypothetical protein
MKMNFPFKTKPGKPIHMKKNMPPILPALRCCLALLVLAFSLLATRSGATTYNPPQLMSYQGYVTDANGNPLGSTNTGPKNYNIVFRIWDLQTGGTTNGTDELYAEQQTVTVNNGYFSVLLGQGTAYATEPHTNALSGLFTPATPANRYVEITVLGIGPAGANITIFPRLQMISSPYSYLAANAVNALNAGTLVNSNNAPTVSIAANGEVGIGTTSPDQELTVNGSADIKGSAIISGNESVSGSGGFYNDLYLDGNYADPLDFQMYNYYGYVFDLGMAWNANDWSTGSEIGDVVLRATYSRIMLQTGNGTPGLTIGYDNYVGINNMINPNYALDVNGRMEDVASGASAGLWLTDPSIGQRAFVGLDTAGYVGLYGNLGAGWGLAMNVTNGFVGIGTSTPRYPLDVENYLYSSLNNYSYLNSSTTPTGHIPGNSGGSYFSIYAYQRIVTGAEFDAASDARIKEIVDRSDTRQDLATVRQLQITDYRKVDKVQFGGRLEKGVIAQEVEGIVPEAVSTSTNYIPNIYAKATAVSCTNQTLLVTMAKPHGLAVGDQVELITDQETLRVRVTAVPSPLVFAVEAGKSAAAQVFVYGKEVGDYRSVNYDRLFTTGLGAIQELAKRMDAVEAREARMAELEHKASQVADLQQEVADLKKLVAQLADAAKHSKLTASAAGLPGTLTTASLDR